MTDVPASSETVAASRLRAAATVLGTVLVVFAEFMLLAYVYDRVAPVSRDQVVIASLAGRLHAATPNVTGDEVGAAVNRLNGSGVSASHLTAARQAAATYNATDPAASTELQHDIDRLGEDLAARHRTLDVEAKFAYVALLVIASFGWMIWFRRLVARHRELQAKLTEQQTSLVGEQRLAALIRNSGDVVAVCDADSTVSFVTPSVRRILGISVGDFIGTRFTSIVHPHDLDVCLHLLASPGAGAETEVMLRVKHADGRTLHVEGTLSNRLADPAVGGLVLTLRDVTARRDMEERLKFQAFHDSLTGMANRQLFGDRLEHALVLRPGGPAELVVLFCDLDDFKSVNDTFGHGAGDQVLVEAGERLRSVVRAGDTAARLGGDEFAVLMESTDLAAAQIVAERMQAALESPFEVAGREVTVRASIGLAHAVTGEVTAEVALRNADVAMYTAKDRGKSAIAVYEAKLHSEAMRRLELRADLQRALTRSELVLHYQPTIDLVTTEIIGFEALVRWQHPTLGLLGPDKFIPMAEETGLILPLGAWVLREACFAAADMQRPELQPKMSVNVASQQLSDPGFVQQVTALLAETQLPSDRLVLEITETVVLGDLEAVTPRLTALRELGVRIAIDDFGTGYSSLAYLSQLPIDLLKVDKSFVDHVTTNEQAASLAEAIIALSHNMKFTTVAEGIEHSDQADWLRELNCAYGQGYLWSRPVPLDDARNLLNAQRQAKRVA
ncbi:bifunctional diguanylate cyclase/phosphodiesterase [Jatrophihabitans sp. GAS493]|uniref:putative bifunctional diguanylate cyclase/phosphodiesterase n=1 Tax=Jatrophihabitans sp. GAS493 TaxID=1907575 RepID=UPI000BB8581C|nr:EAL domain-containing protein [Jatrophihabitans sp. GAS493]